MAEEDFEFGKDCFGLDESQVRLYTAIARHTVLVMAAAQPPAPARQRRALAGLAAPPPGPGTLVPPADKTRP